MLQSESQGWAVFGGTDLYGCSHSEANRSSWNRSSRCTTTVAASSLTLEQHRFGLAVLKLALYSHQKLKYWLSSPMWQNTLPSSMETKDFAPTLQAGYSETSPYSLNLKTQASREEKKFCKGHPQKLWFLVIKGFRCDIPYSPFHFIPFKLRAGFNHWLVSTGI